MAIRHTVGQECPSSSRHLSWKASSGTALRYDKVILATDADVDGMHIRNLMITYFFRFFEQLVHDGHVYILETPLFRDVGQRVPPVSKFS